MSLCASYDIAGVTTPELTRTCEKRRGKKRNKQFIKKMELLRNVSKLKYMENN